VQEIALGIVEDFALNYLPLILFAAFLVAVMMWILAWTSRYFEYLKMLESPYLDRETLDFVHKVLQAVWVAFIAIVILFAMQFRIPEIRTGLIEFNKRVPALFFVIFVIFIAVVLVRILHRFASYLRGDLKVKPRKVAPPRALSFTELFLKYLIYVVAGIVAVLGGIGALPEEDKAYKDLISPYITFPPPAVVLGFVIAIVAIFVASRFIESILDDLKRRSTKFTPKVIEELKSTVKYAVYVIGAVVILILIVDLILPPEQLLVFTVAVIFVGLVVTLIAFESIRNGLAGVTLMLSDSFSVGDRIKVGNDLECYVEATGLLTTQVRTLGGDVISIPNTELTKKSILNVSRSMSGIIVITVALDFSVPYQRVQAAMFEAAQKTPGVEQKPPPQVLGKDVRGTSVQYQLSASTKDVLRKEEIKSELIANLQETFRRENLNPTVSGS